MKTSNWKKPALLASVLAGSILIFGSAQAYGPGGFGPGGCGGGPGMMRAVQTLDLTTEQQQAIRDITTQQREKMQVHWQQMQDIRKSLHEQATSTTYDENRVRELADTKARLQAEMTVQRNATMHQVRQQLTPAQLEKLDSLQQSSFGPGMGRGMGRGMGPGMGMGGYGPGSY
jgi:Spy/CpxP family protein refolding chaperone